MKTFFIRSCCRSACAALAGPAAAQTDLAGTWQGRLEVAPGKTLAIQFVITAQPGGGTAAVVTSPDSGAIKNVPRDERHVRGQQARPSTCPHCPAATPAPCATAFSRASGRRKAQSCRSTLRPYETPTLTQADIDALRGEWFGKITGLVASR